MLVVGGFVYAGTSTVFDDVLLFDESTSALELVGHLPRGRSGHHAVTLPSGDVLVVGGFGAFAEEPDALLLHVVP